MASILNSVAQFRTDPLAKAIIKHVDDVSVSSNELNLAHVVNRNFLKLLDNDRRILELTGKVRNGLYRLLPWNRERTYQKNDFVWFVETYVPPQNLTKYNEGWTERNVLGEDVTFVGLKELSRLAELAGGWTDELKAQREKVEQRCMTTTLFLLRSLKNNNTTRPKLEHINLIPQFDVSGWHNENPFGSIYTDHFPEFLRRLLVAKMQEIHEGNPRYHKFGTLSSYAELNRKVLRTDLKNIDPDRPGFHFPGHTYTIGETNTILGGQCRRWDCGLLEYTIEFKLGTDEEVVDSYNDDGSIRRLDQIDVNYLNLRQRVVMSDDNYNYDNSDYYLDDDDATIFKIPDGDTSGVNDILQVNVDKRINTLQGTIRFPEPFIDTNYAIFCQTPPCVCLPSLRTAVEQNVNQMVFTSKSRQSIVALLIIPTYEGDEAKLLCLNRFRIQVTGRWK